MLKRRIIPCLDVDNDRVVKGTNFVDLVDAGDPVEQATRYNHEGADEICYLDISASPEGRATLADVVERTAASLFVPLTVGGGIRTTDDMHRLLDAGADKVAINTAALANPQLVEDGARLFGSQAIVVAVDARRDGDVYRIFSHGGRSQTERTALPWVRELAERGAGEILLTSMDRDGTGEGYELTLTRRVADAVPIPVIASGGVGELDHIYQGLTVGGASAVLAASIFHYQRHTIGDVKAYLQRRGVPVRPAPDLPGHGPMDV